LCYKLEKKINEQHPKLFSPNKERAFIVPEITDFWKRMEKCRESGRMERSERKKVKEYRLKNFENGSIFVEVTTKTR